MVWGLGVRFEDEEDDDDEAADEDGEAEGKCFFEALGSPSCFASPCGGTKDGDTGAAPNDCGLLPAELWDASVPMAKAMPAAKLASGEEVKDASMASSVGGM